MPIKQFNRFTILISAFVLMLSACSPLATATSALQTIKEEQTATSTSAPPVEIYISTPAFHGVIYPDAVPKALRDQVDAADIPFNASMSLDVSNAGDENGTRFHWVYALVAPVALFLIGIKGKGDMPFELNF